MTLTYHYKEVPRSNHTRNKSPSIPMTLSGTATKFDFTVLIDSGADISAVPKHVAELLGLDLSGKKEETFGIGGSVPAVESKMHIEFGKPHEKYSFPILGEDNNNFPFSRPRSLKIFNLFSGLTIIYPSSIKRLILSLFNIYEK